MAFNRKKQLFAPEVEGLIRELTGFEDNDRNFQEVSKYFFQNIIHHNFATVDFGSVQRSLEGIVDKLSLHGLKSRGKRLQELIERYVTSSLSEHSELQWNVLLLLLRLSFKPTSVSEDSLKSVKLELTTSVEEVEEEEINWYEYLREGDEDFQCPDEDSDVWSEEEEEDYDDEETAKSSTEKSYSSVSPLPSYGDIPHPCLWRLQPPSLTHRETLRSILRDKLKSEQWLQSNVQHSWWVNPSYKTVPESKYPTAHTCDIWEKNKSKGQSGSPLYELQVVSEYKALQEVLWMLQVPTNTSLFHLNDQGHFYIRPNFSLSTCIPATLHSSLADLCPYFNMLHELKTFQEILNHLEHSDSPAPFTFKAYSAELSQQLSSFNKTVVDVETRLNKQEETLTLLSVGEELMSDLNKLRYLYDIHTRATTGCTSDPPWVQVTRLLSVLYEAFLGANDVKHLETSLSLFIHSFHVYLHIINVWLSEGRLEDVREEFLVIRKGDCLEVMPYEQEMRKRGVVPVALLTKLVRVVKDAGNTLEMVGQLNKLMDLRGNMLNKGCLVKEFLKNVNAELNRQKGMMKQHTIAKQEYSTSNSEDTSRSEVQESSSCVVSENCSEPKSAHNALELYSLIPGGDTVLRGYDTFEGSGDENEQRKVASVSPHLSLVSTKILFDNTMRTYLSNPLFAEALKDYVGSREPIQIPLSSPSSELCLGSITLMTVACLHSVLETQVELVETRHKIASKLVTQTLYGEYNLLQHFTVLRSVFFMESGILAQRFYSYLFKEVESGQWRNSVLTVHLQDCVEELFPGFQSCFSVHINRTQAADEVQQAIQAISIAYVVDWPVSLVITDETIDSYNKVFRFLLHLKYAFWVLQNIRFSELSKSPNKLRVRRLQVLKMWMYHSTNTLHSYFMGLVLRCYFEHLSESLQRASSLKDIIKAHKKYLVEVKTHCLQLKKSYLETFIMKLVWQCQDLADLWMMEASGNLVDTDVRDLEQQYLAAYMGLTHCLEAVTSEVNDHINPLWELKDEFLNSIPEVWQESGSVTAAN